MKQVTWLPRDFSTYFGHNWDVSLGNYLINGSFSLRSIEKPANLYQTTRYHPCVRQPSQWPLWEPRLVPRFVLPQRTNPIKPDCQTALVLTENIITDSKSLSSKQKAVGICHLTHSRYILRSFWHSHSFKKVKNNSQGYSVLLHHQSFILLADKAPLMTATITVLCLTFRF